jgi:hypothetical protein
MRSGAHHVSEFFVASVFPSIAQGADRVMKNVDERVLRLEQRLLRKIGTRLVLAFGGVFLVLALFFLLKDSFGWSQAAASFAIGIVAFVIGLVLIALESK